MLNISKSVLFDQKQHWMASSARFETEKLAVAGNWKSNVLFSLTKRNLVIQIEEGATFFILYRPLSVLCMLCVRRREDKSQFPHKASLERLDNAEMWSRDVFRNAEMPSLYWSF